MLADNALITIDGPEIPIMDGSSLKFVEAIEKVGYEDQNTERTYFELSENISGKMKKKALNF